MPTEIVLVGPSSAFDRPGPPLPLRITHFALQLHSVGGLQSIRHHPLAADPAWGHDSRFVVVFALVDLERHEPWWALAELPDAGTFLARLRAVGSPA